MHELALSRKGERSFGLLAWNSQGKKAVIFTKAGS